MGTLLGHKITDEMAVTLVSGPYVLIEVLKAMGSRSIKGRRLLKIP